MKRRTEAERREILQGLLANQYQLLDTEEKIRFCAFPITMGGLKDWKQEDIADIGMLLGVRGTEIGSRELVGVGPLYGEVTLVHKEDWKLIAEAYNREVEKLKKVKV